MTTYIIRRLIHGLAILVLVSLMIFFAMRLLPGDPLIIYVGRSMEMGTISPERIEQLQQEFGLDRPVMMQYVDWLWDILRGDLGRSILYREKVSTLIWERLPITVHLGFLSLIVGAVFGIIGGMLAAVRRGRLLDTLVTFIANIGITIPVFWLGILLIYLFGLKLGWLPISGYTSPFENFWMSTKQIIMPVICLAVFPLAANMRQMRSSMLEVIRQDYIRTAWSKGLSEHSVITDHALKNSLIPVITLIGMGIGPVVGGAVLVEMVFAIPGIGRLLVSSIFDQDYVVVQAIVLVVTVTIVMVNLIIDILYGWLDPRIRYR